MSGWGEWKAPGNTQHTCLTEHDPKLPKHNIWEQLRVQCITQLVARRLRQFAGRSLRDQIFFLLRTALKDRPKGPPTANRQVPSTTTANFHQPPTATNHQPPTATNRRPPTANHQPPATNCRQPPTATNRQLLTTANHCQPPPPTNHQSPTTNCHQPPPTASCKPPTANRPRHQPWLSTWSARGLFWENCFRNTFFPPLRTALTVRGHGLHHMQAADPHMRSALWVIAREIIAAHTTDRGPLDR